MRSAGGVRLIVTSPPYPDARTPEQYGGAEFDTSLKGYGNLGEAVFDALVPGGVCALNIDGPIRRWRDVGPQHLQLAAPLRGSEDSERSLIAFKVAIDWAERIGFRFIERVSYAREGVPGQRGPRWRTGQEPVLVFARPGGEVYFDANGYTLPAKRAGESWSAGSARFNGGHRARSAWVQGDRRQLTTSIVAHVGSNQTDSDHPAPFARELADAFVLCYSAPGDTVGDPFVGSGTVAESCGRYERRFVGGDIGHRERDGRRWADIVREGCSQGTLGLALLEQAGAR